MKPKEIDQIIENIITSEVKKAFLKENQEKKYEVFQITCEGEPVECLKSMEEAEEHVDKLKKDHPGKQFIIEKKSYNSYGDMIDELENMGEQLEEKENQNMENQEPMEGNAFAYAAMKAKKAGEKTFKFGGKQHDVEECWKQLEEEESSEWNEEVECKECGDKSMEEELHGDQDKLDVDGDGEIEASDLSKLRSDDDKEEECNECGDKSMEEDASLDGVVKKLYNKIHGGEQSMEEEKKVCEKCGKDICECGVMNESKKKVLRLTETELMSFIRNIVNETVPGLEAVRKSKSDDKGTKEHLSDVEKKMKDYLSFDGNDNPEFPKAIGKGEVVARQADDEESDEVADQRGGGMEDLNYDVEPSDKFKERLKKALEGDSTMGNSQEAAGVIKTDTGKKLAEKVKMKDKKEEEAPMYHKDPQPVKKLSESKVTFEGIVKEEIDKMKKLSSYNKKTQ